MPGEMKLKPCPFCGDEAHVSKIDFHFDPNQHEYRVNCLNYRCLGKASHTNNFKTEEEAISEWNRRVPEPGTSVIRWTRYDGTPETLPEDGATIIHAPFKNWRTGDFHNEFDGEKNRVGSYALNFGMMEGDIWAHLPAPPEGME